MNIRDYFEKTRGTGVLATADARGIVNTAIYARPHVFDDSTIAFIMRNRLSRKNVLENGYASYLFRENGTGYSGCRLSLKMVSESNDAEQISKLSSREPDKVKETTEERFLVKFTIEKSRVLIGDEEMVF